MNNLKRIREIENYTQSYVAEQLGITQQAYANYERGARQPDNEMLKKMSKFFNVSVDCILGIEAESTEISTARERAGKLFSEKTHTFDEIEKTFGTHYNTLKAWFDGFGDFFNEKISELASYLGVSTDYLLGRTNEPNQIDLDKELEGVQFALYSETKELTDEEKKSVLDFVKFLKSQKEKE